MFIYHKDGNILAVSDSSIGLEGSLVLSVDKIPCSPKELIRQYKVKDNQLQKKVRRVDSKQAKIAFVCVWGIECGIATYGGYLVEAMRELGADVKVFAERFPGCEDDIRTTYCWSRGQSLTSLQQEIKDYDPDFVYVQHEYGIFPDARAWTKFISFLDSYNYVVALHSVYWHKDKTVCEAILRNIVVHSEAAKEVLEKKGVQGNIRVIPHGCIDGKETTRLWNIYRTPHTMMQFGFGFEYKGWDVALEAVRLLKEKYPDIFYLIIFSESSFSVDYHSSQYYKLEKLVQEKGISENVAIIRGFQKDEVIDTFLRTVKVAVFPYSSHPNHIVYGSTGAARIAIANGTPTVVSTLPLFSDLEGVVPRVEGPLQLAEEIDKLFSNKDYYNSVRDKGIQYVKDTSWEKVAKMYLSLIQPP